MTNLEPWQPEEVQEQPVLKVVKHEPEFELRDFILEITQKEKESPNYWIPDDPSEYATDVGMADCVGQSNVTIANWFKVLKELGLMPPWYLQNKDGSYTAPAIIEFTNWGIACGKELPERESNGQPKFDELGKLKKFTNKLFKKYGKSYYIPLLEERFKKYQESPQSALAVKPQSAIEPEILDDSWVRRDGNMRTRLSCAQRQVSRIKAGVGGQLIDSLRSLYRQAGREGGMELVEEYLGGIDESTSAAGIGFVNSNSLEEADEDD